MGKIIISVKIKENMNDLSFVMNMIKDNELVANDKISGSDYIIVLDENDKERLNSHLKYQYNGKIV